MPVDSTLTYSKIVERYAHFFDRPEIRLRFLNNTLAQQAASRERADAALRRFHFIKKTEFYEQLLKIWLYKLILQELNNLLPSTSKKGRRILSLKGRAPFSARIFFRCYQFRHAVYGVGLVTCALALFGAYSGVVWSAQRVNNYLIARYQTGAGKTGGTRSQSTVFAQTSAKHLPDYKPEKVWLVEQKENYERYSNGTRILNDYETQNRARSYYIYKESRPDTEKGVRQEPVGIVYHTSESDMLPFTSENNESIETHTRGLLEYVRRHKSYNYVIDRFGQIYRIVRDSDAANHAGNSIWADARGTYVGLNESFIGVCFETKMEADSGEERLTEAQLVAGRLLTQVLRSRHQIDDANCVTHGLVSVNPSKMLICFHHDWARGFPFDAMGLSDKYQVAPAGVAEFGFTYDEEVAAKLGGAMWPGVSAAEEAFSRRASEAKRSVEEMRKLMRNLYREQMAAQQRLRTSAGEATGIGPSGQESD